MSTPHRVVTGHFQSSVVRNTTANSEVRIDGKVAGSPRRVVAQEGCQRGELPAGRHSRNHDTIRASPVLPNGVFYPGERARHVLDMCGPHGRRREGVVAGHYDEAVLQQFVQQGTTLFTFIAHDPRATMNEKENGRVLKVLRPTPDIEAIAFGRAVDDVLVETHASRMRRQHERRPPPRSVAVITPPRHDQGHLHIGGDGPAHARVHEIHVHAEEKVE